MIDYLHCCVQTMMKNSIACFYTPRFTSYPKALYLNRFWNLFNSVLEFLKEKDVVLKDKLFQLKADATYMTDLFTKFTASRRGPQFDYNKSLTSAFLKKLTLWKQNCGHKEFSQFPIL